MEAAAVSDDVIEEILSKLPVKSLLRFTCACKTWYSIISNPQFSKLIMRPGLLICKNFRDFSTINIESLLKKDGATTTPVSSFPWETTDGKTTCIGSSRGLICVDHRSSTSVDVDKSGLIVCNPSTRKFRTLPRPRRYLHYDWWTYAWFGYDESIDDYKLVWLNFSHLPGRAELDVFTLKSNTWNTWRRRAVDHIAVGYSDSMEQRSGGDHRIFTGGVLYNKAIHWVTDYFPTEFRSEKVILVLDLATEKCRLHEFSHSPLGRSYRVGSLGDECLWVWNLVYGGGFIGSNLWMMDEYGVESSWTKVLSIRGRVIWYPILVSKENEGKEMVVICLVKGLESEHIVKLRVEEGKVKSEILFGIPRNVVQCRIIVPYIIPHMGESLVSIG